MSERKPAPPPEHFNTGDMKRDWDARARACAREYILTGFADQPEGFVRSGREAAASLLAFCAPGAVVLDLGCGVGRVARELEAYVAEIHAVDVSAEMIRQAREYVGPGSRIRFHVNDGFTLPQLAVGSVDFAFSLLTMHHVTRPAFESYLRASFTGSSSPGGDSGSPSSRGTAPPPTTWTTRATPSPAGRAPTRSWTGFSAGASRRSGAGSRSRVRVIGA